MTGGEKRLAERLEDKLEEDYLCWYDVSIGDQTRHPDFVVFHPSRSLPEWFKLVVQMIHPDTNSNPFTPDHDSVKIVTMHSSKGLEFPVVCIPGVGSTGPHAESAEEEARLLYVAMTRATHELVMTHGEPSVIAEKIEKAMGALDVI
jgi:ATP-dependent exoDNAse (exonuclease V) beta subunit